MFLRPCFCRSFVAWLQYLLPSLPLPQIMERIGEAFMSKPDEIFFLSALHCILVLMKREEAGILGVAVPVCSNTLSCHKFTTNPPVCLLFVLTSLAGIKFVMGRPSAVTSTDECVRNCIDCAMKTGQNSTRCLQGI